MPYNPAYNLLGQKVSDTYHWILQSGSDGKFYDGDGNEVTINATIPNIYVLTSSFNSFTSSYNTGSFTGSFTGSLLGTASWAQNAISSSYATYAANGGVTQITAGTGVIISPPTGLGNVTVTSLAPSYNTATGSYGSFFSTGSQTAVLATQIYSMSISTTDISNGVYISGSGDPYNTFVKFTNAGTYNIQFSAQFANSGASPSDVVIWLRKNDVSSANDLADSSGICTVPAKKGNTNGQLIASWNYFINVAAGDFIQLLWHTADANVITLETINAGTNPTHPRTPALILTAQRVDTFLSNTGSFSGSFTGDFTGSLLGTASWADNATTASYVLNAVSSSFASTASFAPNYLLVSSTSSMLAPYVLNSQTGSFTLTSSFNNFTASYTTGSFTGSFTGSLSGTGSWAVSASQAVTASYILDAISSSFASTASFAPSYLPVGSTSSMLQPYVLTSTTASMLSSYVLNSQTSSFATTGSNIFNGNQTITGSINITGSLTVAGSINATSLTGSLSGTASFVADPTVVTDLFNLTASVNIGNNLAASPVTASVGQFSLPANTASGSMVTITGFFSSTASTNTKTVVILVNDNATTLTLAAFTGGLQFTFPARVINSTTIRFYRLGGTITTTLAPSFVDITSVGGVWTLKTSTSVNTSSGPGITNTLEALTVRL